MTKGTTIRGLRRRGLRMLLAATTILASATGVALATIPGSNGIINGCYEKRTGILRVIDDEAGKKCLSLETPISWNQRGQQGLQGSQGQKGDKGDPGKDGLNGSDGIDGKDGVSVTSANEPAGANCTYGGSAFTAGNGVTYACNGAPGAAGRLPGLHYVTDDRVAYGKSESEVVHTTQAEMRCPVNEAAIGGGFINNSFHELVLRSGFPTGSPANGTSAWAVEVDNDTSIDWFFSLYAVCAPVL